MSTQSIITLNNLPTDVAMSQYLREASLDLIKNLRFEIGCVDNSKLAEMLRLHRLACNKYCYVTSEEDTTIRENIIRKAITKIYEL
jgi:hypothetical protein